MLTETDRELIAAAVDGELSPDQELAFRALLAGNPSAGFLFAQLQGDSRRLRELPRRAAPAGLADSVVERIASLPRATPVRVRTPQRSQRVSWMPYVVAASLLFAVAVTSFWLSFREAPEDSGRIVRKQRLPRIQSQDERFARSPVVPEALATEVGPTPREVLPGIKGDAESQLATLPHPGVIVPESAPLPRPAGFGDVVGSRFLGSIPPFETVEARLPVLTTVTDFDHKAVLEQITSELNKDPAFRLDLFVKDVYRATASFQAAARDSKVAVTVESSAQDRIHKKMATALAIYAENLTPDDITRLLTALAKRDRDDKNGPAFTTAHLVPVQSADRDIRDLLGLDITTSKRKPGLPKQTPTGLASEKGKPTASAIMLTYSPLAFRANPTASKELKSFLDHRQDRKPAGNTLLVVIRPAF